MISREDRSLTVSSVNVCHESAAEENGAGHQGMEHGN